MDVRDTILAELEVSRRIVGNGHEVVPRFTIFAPDGTHAVTAQLPNDPLERVKRLQVVRTFMVWKAARSFVMANELVGPEAISVIAVTKSDVIGVMQRINREPLGFDPPVWFDRENVGDEVVALLPPKELVVTQEELAFMRQAFQEGSAPGITWRRHGED